jgi:hypothetical protein
MESSINNVTRENDKLVGELENRTSQLNFKVHIPNNNKARNMDREGPILQRGARRNEKRKQTLTA